MERRSGADFLLHVMPKIIDALAEDYLGTTLPVRGVDDVRKLITSGIMVAFIVVCAMVAANEGIEIVSLDLER